MTNQSSDYILAEGVDESVRELILIDHIRKSVATMQSGLHNEMKMQQHYLEKENLVVQRTETEKEKCEKTW